MTASRLSGRFDEFVTNEAVTLVYGTGSVSVRVLPEPGTLAPAATLLLGLLTRRR